MQPLILVTIMIKLSIHFNKRGNLIRRIAFFDIDGTLYGFDGKEHKIPESTIITLKKFRENGNLTFIGYFLQR